MNLYLCGQRAFGRAVLEMCLAEGHTVVGVSAPMSSQRAEDRADRLRLSAEEAGIPVLLPGLLSAESLPAGVDVILAAHSHDFIGRKTRLRARMGAIGYHPSLLPLHRGRDAVRWTIRDGDKITGGSIYWLSDTVDAGDLAAQDWCFVDPDDTVESLWREKLFPLGVKLFKRALADLQRGTVVAVSQEHHMATWEPSWDRQPLRRPDLLMIGQGMDGMRVVRESGALH
jgi:methionyl-tRNA formyltransferase